MKSSGFHGHEIQKYTGYLLVFSGRAVIGEISQIS